jgi:hypothetical protein
MSRAFLDRNNQSDSNSSNKNTSQQKATYEAQMKRLDDMINNPRGKTFYSPAQMFAEKEEERQAKARDEEELQMKTDEEELQMKEDPGNSGTKTDMPDDVQNKMENSFGVDFSDVNIHKDSQQAPRLSALAYTQGNDLHFAPGQYNPGSKEGQELLGHELSHVVQQREDRVKPTTQDKGMSVNNDPALEKEADEQGKQAAQGRMADVKGKGSGVQRRKNTFNSEEKDTPPTVKRYEAEGHSSGYQHIFDRNGNLIILYPVIGPDIFYITRETDAISQKDDNAGIGVGSLEQVPLQKVKEGLFAYYKDRPEEEVDFVDRLYLQDKQDGYDYIQYRSVKNLAQAHEDFFTGGGWMMIAVGMLPLIIEAIPFIIQSSPHLLSKMPRSLVIKALKTKTGHYFLKGTGESILDALIQYLFTDDVDLTSIGVNYVPGMGKTKKAKYIMEGLKQLADASVDYKLGEKELKMLIEEKRTSEVLIDLISGTVAGAVNGNIDEEFSQAVYRFILKGEFNILTSGFKEAIKNQFENEKAGKNAQK